MEHIRNIGILAHVDAGKTTLTEQILLATGAIRNAGRVDAGTAHTDMLPVERQRGISVRSGTVSVRYGGYSIRIIDTPGHVDFSADVENALSVIDGVVLVVSAVEGVQAQTVEILRVLGYMGIPAIIFMNKVDRTGADIERVVTELTALTPRVVLANGGMELLTERLSEYDEEVLYQALYGNVTEKMLRAALARGCRNREVTPVYLGSALRGEGIGGVLDGIVCCLPPPTPVEGLSVAAYHVQRVGGERRVHVRVFGGELRRGNEYGGQRVSWLRSLNETGLTSTDVLTAGDIGVIIGADSLRPGDWLGKRARGRPNISHPVLRAQVVPQEDALLPATLLALERMQDEQPELAVTYEPRTRRVHVRVMGEIQQEIVEQTLFETYGVTASLMPPEVLYKETVIGSAVGELDMFFSPWLAKALLEVKPLPRGSGVRFHSVVPADLYLKYQRSIEEAVYESLREGISGWPVTDVEVTLLDGKCPGPTKPSARFGPVIPLALFDALRKAGTRMLEPMLSFQVLSDARSAGTLLYELSLARASYDPPQYEQDMVRVTGRVPVETTLRFAARIHELSHGRGFWRTRFDGYDAAPPGCGHSVERTTPDPLNKELYMMYINNAIATRL